MTPENHAPRHFLTLKDYNKAEIMQILTLAKDVKAHPDQYCNNLRGMQLAMLFQKTSTRTRVSFEVGINQLGGQSLYLDWRTTNFTLGAIKDEIHCMSRYVDLIMARVYEHTELLEMASAATVPLINGLSDLYHPCQAVADIMTVDENLDLKTKPKIVFVGDGGNNVSISLIVICAILGLPITIIAPPEYQPNSDLIKWLKEEKLDKFLKVTDDINAGIVGAEVIYTDTFVSMGQEAEARKRLAIFKPYQVNETLIQASGKDPIIMHCLPAHRGVEITSEILDSQKSVVFDQSENRLHTQKALMMFLLGKMENSD